MRRRASFAVGLVLLVVAVAGVNGSDTAPNVPPGVKPENWRSISADVGIALHPKVGSVYQGPLVGTLMVRSGERWRAVELVPGSGTVPAH